MERFTISLDERLAEQFDSFLERRGYRNRSEAVRDLLREKLESERLANAREGECVGTLTYIFNHHERELASRLTRVQHQHHDLAVATLHVHLDHDHCMETLAVSGPTQQVQAFADAIIASPGVRHGKLYLVPVESDDAAHTHGQGTAVSGSNHSHKRPRT